MASNTSHENRDAIPVMERPSGVPPPGKLGASRGEMISLVLGLLLFLVIALSFWYEASH